MNIEIIRHHNKEFLLLTNVCGIWPFQNTEICQAYSCSNAKHNTRSLVDSQNLPLPSDHKLEGLVNLI